jgi:Family of unknown function (DUF6459)
MSSDLNVVPIIDYEPPIGEPRHTSPPRVLHRRRLTVVPPPPEQPSARAAAAFADAALRGVLEVLDGRRPFAQLQPLLGDGLADTVVALARSSRGSPVAMAARLNRVRLRIVDREGDEAEVFATYNRGERVAAIAGRVRQAEIRGRRRWRLVALQMG